MELLFRKIYGGVSTLSPKFFGLISTPFKLIPNILLFKLNHKSIGIGIGIGISIGL